MNSCAEAKLHLKSLVGLSSAAIQYQLSSITVPLILLLDVEHEKKTKPTEREGSRKGRDVYRKGNDRLEQVASERCFLFHSISIKDIFCHCRRNLSIIVYENNLNLTSKIED